MPTIYLLSKNKKNIEIFLLKIFIFYNFKNLCILHGLVFEMAKINLIGGQLSMVIIISSIILFFPFCRYPVHVFSINCQLFLFTLLLKII